MRSVIIGLAILFSTAASAQAVTLRDIVELTKAGLGDEVLLALIEVDARVFNIDADTLTQLKAAGVSEKVIVALVRSGRTPPPVPEAPSVESAVTEPVPPLVVYVDRPSAPIVREVGVPVPVYIAVPVESRGRRGRQDPQQGQDQRQRVDMVQPSIAAPIGIQGPPRFLTDTPREPERKEPVYWGSGGKLRPDAWKPK